MTLRRFSDNVAATALPGMVVLRVVTEVPPKAIGPILTTVTPIILYVGTVTIIVDVLDTKVGIPKYVTSPIAIVGFTAAVAPEILVISAGWFVVSGVSHISEMISQNISMEKVEEIKEVMQQRSWIAYESLPSREEVRDTLQTMYGYCPSQEDMEEIKNRLYSI